GHAAVPARGRPARSRRPAVRSSRASNRRWSLRPRQGVSSLGSMLFVLRWHLEHGVSAIPKSVKPHRIKENLDVLDFAPAIDAQQSMRTFKSGGRYPHRMSQRAIELTPRQRVTVLSHDDRQRLQRRARLLAWSGNGWHLIEFAVA